MPWAARWKWLVALLWPGLAWGGGPAEPVLQLYYYDRPPFHYTDEQGQVVGTVVDATEEALRRARIQFHWVRMPVNRILTLMRKESRPACSPGWYSTPERRADFLFSKATVLDKPLIVMVRENFPVAEGITAKDFFERTTVRLLVRQNFSQGAYMGALIARIPPQRVERVNLEVPRMLRMLQAGRGDAVLMTEAEAALFVREAGLQMSDFRVVRFPDIPAEEYRYILCDRVVGAGVMARIDSAIQLKKP
jgi:uncharacterized protein (TIGR02285 family)